MNIALVIIFVFLALALFLGIRARRGQDMDLEQWTVGGRGFGTLFVFLLLAGEIYTTFTFSLMHNNFVNKWGAGAGIAAGVATVSYVTAAETTIGELFPFLPQALADTNIGVVALLINLVVLVAVSFATGGFAVRREQSA